MEDMRKFERKCLRLCAGIRRTPESDYVKYVSNKKLYDKLNVNRIDSHIISLIRRHWQRASCNFNSPIYGPVLSIVTLKVACPLATSRLRHLLIQTKIIIFTGLQRCPDFVSRDKAGTQKMHTISTTDTYSYGESIHLLI